MLALRERTTVVDGCRKTSGWDAVYKIESTLDLDGAVRRRDGSSITTLSYCNRLQFFIVRITFTPSVCSRNQHDVIYDPDQREQRSRICKLLVSFTSTTNQPLLTARIVNTSRPNTNISCSNLVRYMPVDSSTGRGTHTVDLLLVPVRFILSGTQCHSLRDVARNNPLHHKCDNHVACTTLQLQN